MKNVIKMLSVMTVVALVGVSASANTKVSGFVDAQYNWTNTAVAPNNLGQFMVADGAVYVSKEMDGGKAMADLGFTAAGVTVDQAYVNYKYAGGLWWTLGLFDSHFGIQANDSADFVFSGAGLVYNRAILPKTFTGLQLGYDMGNDMSLNVVLGTPFTKIFAPQFKYNGTVRFGVGANIDLTTTGTTAYLIDAKVGGDFGNIGVDVGFNYDNTSAIGITAQAVMKDLMDKVNAGARFDMQTAAGASTFGITVGPQFAMTKDMTVKADYTLTSASGTMTHGIALAGVHKF